jgi:hypothetical protein
VRVVRSGYQAIRHCGKHIHVVIYSVDRLSYVGTVCDREVKLDADVRCAVASAHAW